jgi:hypothetical protein
LRSLCGFNLAPLGHGAVQHSMTANGDVIKFSGFRLEDRDAQIRKSSVFQ